VIYQTTRQATTGNEPTISTSVFQSSISNPRLREDQSLNNLMDLVAAHWRIFGHGRVYERVVKLVMSEVMAFGRHTVTQQLMVLGGMEKIGVGGTGYLVEIE
jgi:hypothetical protein